jgi:hypothetical protein
MHLDPVSNATLADAALTAKVTGRRYFEMSFTPGTILSIGIGIGYTVNQNVVRSSDSLNLPFHPLPSDTRVLWLKIGPHALSGGSDPNNPEIVYGVTIDAAGISEAPHPLGYHVDVIPTPEGVRLGFEIDLDNGACTGIYANGVLLDPLATLTGQYEYLISHPPSNTTFDLTAAYMAGQDWYHMTHWSPSTPVWPMASLNGLYYLGNGVYANESGTTVQLHTWPNEVLYLPSSAIAWDS